MEIVPGDGTIAAVDARIHSAIVVRHDSLEDVSAALDQTVPSESGSSFLLGT